MCANVNYASNSLPESQTHSQVKFKLSSSEDDIHKRKGLWADT